MVGPLKVKLREFPPLSEEEMRSSKEEEVEMALVDDPELSDDPVIKLGNGGIILVLCETPSGFVLFSYDGVKLLEPNAIEDIWGEFFMDFMAEKHAIFLRDSVTIEDKASALNLDTGVNKQLANKIQEYIEPEQKLAVGKPEYQLIIKKHLGIECLYTDEVKELMWGLNNLMPYLLSHENSELAKEDCLPMCEGMKIVLNRHGYDVKPEIVNRSIIEATGLVYQCDYNVRKHAEHLGYAGKHLKKISGINFEEWDLLKLAAALVILCFGEEHVSGNPKKLFGDDYSKLVEDAPKYEDKLCKLVCLKVYQEMLLARRLRYKAARRLQKAIIRAKAAYEAKQAVSQE